MISLSESSPVVDQLTTFSELLESLHPKDYLVNSESLSNLEHFEAYVNRLRHESTKCGLLFFGDAFVEPLECAGLLNSILSASIGLGEQLALLSQEQSGRFNQFYLDLFKGLMSQYASLASQALARHNQRAHQPRPRGKKPIRQEETKEHLSTIGIIWKFCDELSAAPKTSSGVSIQVVKTYFQKLQDAMKELLEIQQKNRIRQDKIESGEEMDESDGDIDDLLGELEESLNVDGDMTPALKATQSDESSKMIKDFTIQIFTHLIAIVKLSGSTIQKTYGFIQTISLTDKPTLTILDNIVSDVETISLSADSLLEHIYFHEDPIPDANSIFTAITALLVHITEAAPSTQTQQVPAWLSVIENIRLTHGRDIDAAIISAGWNSSKFVN
ncbi:putative Grap2 and cyclin-D-interacting [Blattamonas nauphoetae]|uniref:Grap2 and cyclin-D-interacting n=1 Tax=Blattamonas nauphoetae TaxID=2049346 RepID=A0ABQ9Y9T6_9EUKA|nr:putative Grap2 and cyclin-D-interacting [Blattamonas nauphoetae]